MTVWFGGGTPPVGIAVDDGDLVALVRSLFRPLLLQEDPDGEPQLALRRHGRAGYRVTGSGAASERRFRALPYALAWLEHQATGLLMRGWRDHTFLHGSAVALAGGAVIAVGPSGSGKSSVCFAASLAGYPVLSDDCLILDERGRVQGLPRLVKVHRRQLRLNGLSAAETVAPHPRVAEVWWDPERSGGWAPGWHDVAVVARISRIPGAAPPRIRRVPRGQGLQILLGNLLGGGLDEAASLDRLVGVARHAEFVDLRFATAEQAMTALTALTGAGVP